MAEGLVVSIIIYLVVGAFVGTLSGLIGIGGGVVIVPVLVWTFHHAGFNSSSVIHMAAGTSLAVMIVTMARALHLHSRYKVEYKSIFFKFIWGIAVGAIAGVVIAHFLHSVVLSDILGGVLVLVAIRMLIVRQVKTGNHNLPGRLASTFIAFFVGGLSGLLGIGGGSLMIPFLSYCGVEMRRVVIVSVAVGLTSGIVGAISALVTGLGAPGLPPYAIGYVYWPAWLGISVGGLIFVPLGTRLSHSAPVLVLKRIFAVLLLVVGLHMLFHF